jgi:hypothetical protein
MQTKLSQFFSIKTEFNAKHKRCFIYDPEKSRAIFETEPQAKDVFIVKKLGISLYLRNCVVEKYDLPTIKTDAKIPLLKSNLQKAVRRGKNIVAMGTALAMLQKEPVELVRRLAIICIEDVCVMDTYPVLVWLMMTDKHYLPTTGDFYLILQIVNSLCNCTETFDHTYKYKDFVLNHESLQDLKRHDVLLALFYRQKYGGMKGDIEMLNSGISYYTANYGQIVKTDFSTIDFEIPDELEILECAVDFSPFPFILDNINKKTGLDNGKIKEFIWFAESAWNFRKLHTQIRSENYKSRPEWELIEKHLHNERGRL